MRSSLNLISIVPVTLALAVMGTPAYAQDAGEVETLASQSEVVDALEATETQHPVMTSAEVKEAGGSLPEIVESPDVVPGLEDLQARGIQGQSVVQFIIQADGTITETTIASSSKSDELDQVALELVDLFVAKAALDAEGQPVAVSVKMPLNFWKDSLVDGSLIEKTCADFVIDADWFLSVNPESSIKDMRVWLMTSGAFISAFFNSGRASESMADRFKNAPRPDPDELYQYCSQKPKKKFFESFRKLG